MIEERKGERVRSETSLFPFDKVRALRF